MGTAQLKGEEGRKAGQEHHWGDGFALLREEDVQYLGRAVRVADEEGGLQRRTSLQIWRWDQGELNKELTRLMLEGLSLLQRLQGPGTDCDNVSLWSQGFVHLL